MHYFSYHFNMFRLSSKIMLAPLTGKRCS